MNRRTYPKGILSLFLLLFLILPSGVVSYAEEIQVGDTVRFGHYEQDNDPSDGKEVIEWQVLDAKDDRVLLISSNILDTVTYHRTWDDMTWEYCSLRTWLNEEFLIEAFSADEQKYILTSVIDNSHDQGNWDWDSDGENYGGKDPLDQIFLLSYAEAKKYFLDDSARRCKPTAYADQYSLSEYSDGYGYWWLRSPGGLQSEAAMVDYTGSLEWPWPVYDDGAGIGVRPVLWVRTK